MSDERTKRLQEPATRTILSTLADPKQDLRAERARASFNSEELCAFVHGGKQILQRRRELARLLDQQPWSDKSRRYFWTRDEEHVRCMEAGFGIRELVMKEGLTYDDGLVLRQLTDMPGGLELHIGMFIPALMGQATPEQQAVWLKAAQRLEIIGTYAQTELGHGTFVRGLETTATYDKEKKEFVLHSPTLTATKWWPGGLAKTATHAVVMARMFIDGRDLGPHPFVVQVRCLESHRPLPGITVGDIGPKFGYNAVDNGFLRFDHVRIPLDQLLAKNAQVTPDGRYIPPPPENQKAAYGTMVFVRATIVRDAGVALARAATIATRYCAVRRQSTPGPQNIETQVLDYENCQAVLIPSIAAAYALHFMGKHLMGLYEAAEADKDRGEFGRVPELHALSSGLKALCTDITADRIELCRRTCGGHGFSALSGLPHAYAYYVQNVTWEGDNPVMYLQCARYLMKKLQAALAGVRQSDAAAAAEPSGAYLAAARQELAPGARSAAQGPACWAKPEVQLAAMRHVAIRLAATAAAELAEAAGGKGPLPLEGPAWNSCTVSLIKAAKAHCYVSLLETFALVPPTAPCPASAAALGALGALFGLGALQDYAGVMLEDGFIAPGQAAAIRPAIRSLMRALRPDAVALVDSFGFEDSFLNSALGRKDGDVYRALYDMAQGSPFNRTVEGPAWEKVLKPGMARPKYVKGPGAGAAAGAAVGVGAAQAAAPRSKL